MFMNVFMRTIWHRSSRESAGLRTGKRLTFFARAKKVSKESTPQLRQYGAGYFGVLRPSLRGCWLRARADAASCLISAAPAIPAGAPGQQPHIAGWRRWVPVFSIKIGGFGFPPSHSDGSAQSALSARLTSRAAERAGGVVGEDCLSAQREFRSRRQNLSSAGYRALFARRGIGHVSLVTFFAPKKVTRPPGRDPARPANHSPLATKTVPSTKHEPQHAGI
jgi:hypothetical protein